MPLNDRFPVGLKREIVSALRPVFGDEFPIPELRNKIYIGLDYPDRDITYPAIFVNLNIDTIENVGLGHYEYDSESHRYKHFIFSGRLNFAIMAQTPTDRDELSAAIVQLLAMSEVVPGFEDFKHEIQDNDYVMLTLLSDHITPGGEQTGTVPWEDDEEILFTNSYSVALYGEFYSDVNTGDTIAISEIDIYPYLSEEEPAPW